MDVMPVDELACGPGVDKGQDGFHLRGIGGFDFDFKSERGRVVFGGSNDEFGQ